MEGRVMIAPEGIAEDLDLRWHADIAIRLFSGFSEK